MRTTRRFPKLMTLLCASSLAFALGACGDDDDDDDVMTPDAAAPIDADTTPDAAIDAGPQSTRTGTMAIVDLALMDSAGAEAAWYKGASVSISYTQFPPAILPDVDTFAGGLTGCAATLYDLGGGETPPTQIDEGAITIGGAGLASLMGPCTLVGDDYTCIAGTGVGAAGDAVGFDATAMLPTYKFSTHATGGDFTAGHIGTYVSVSGAANATNDGAFPVLGFTDADTIKLGNTAPDFTTTPSLDGATYAVVTGAGPTPARIPFLTDGQMLEVSKTDGTDVEAIATRMITVGLGYRPDNTTMDMMRALPIDSTTDISFTCESGDGGDCGNAAGGTLVAVTVTNADLTGASPFDVPAGANVVSVSCREFGNSVTIPVSILDLIESMSPAPTRAHHAVPGQLRRGNQRGRHEPNRYRCRRRVHEVH